MGVWKTGRLRFKDRQFISITALLAKLAIFNGLNFLNGLNDLNLILWLPAAAQSAVELHHSIDLVPASACEQQLLIE